MITPSASLAGDIAFRFLEYVRARRERRAALSTQTLLWRHVTDDYAAAGGEAGPPESRAVVCDINKEMLRVGKRKADGAGIGAGERFGCGMALWVSMTTLTVVWGGLRSNPSPFLCTRSVVGGGRRRGASLWGRPVRCLHHRLWHSKRHPH